MNRLLNISRLYLIASRLGLSVPICHRDHDVSVCRLFAYWRMMFVNYFPFTFCFNK